MHSYTCSHSYTQMYTQSQLYTHKHILIQSNYDSVLQIHTLAHAYSLIFTHMLRHNQPLTQKTICLDYFHIYTDALIHACTYLHTHIPTSILSITSSHMFTLIYLYKLNAHSSILPYLTLINFCTNKQEHSHRLTHTIT